MVSDQHLGDQRLARSRNEDWARLTVFQIYSHGIVDDCRVLFLDEIVLGETLDMQDQVWWQPGEMMTLERRSNLLRALAIKFGENSAQRHLRNDLHFVQILEEWGGG